jgi:three-Cys-motif partner protein
MASAGAEPAMSANDDFFKGKRPWSTIKDDVLRLYMPRYLAKVNTLGKRIKLIDGYAGMGVYDDGSEGSPLIMCRQAERCARGSYDAIFVNKDRRGLFSPRQDRAAGQ